MSEFLYLIKNVYVNQFISMCNSNQIILHQKTGWKVLKKEKKYFNTKNMPHHAINLTIQMKYQT